MMPASQLRSCAGNPDPGRYKKLGGHERKTQNKIIVSHNNNAHGSRGLRVV
jgi:hypothetical protein